MHGQARQTVGHINVPLQQHISLQKDKLMWKPFLEHSDLVLTSF